MGQTGPWEAAIEDALRGIAGGLIFGVPLLYTMEMWELGQTAKPGLGLIALLLTFVAVLLLVATSGFRNRPELTRIDVLVDVVTAVGLGLFSVAVVLVILQRITFATPLPVAIQMIVFEAAPFSIGAAVATEVFSWAGDKPRSPDREGRGTARGDDDRGPRATISDLGAAAVGATFIGLSIAPTEEVPMLASGIETPWLVVLIAASLVVTYTIVFTAGFSNEERRRQQIGVLQRPATETAGAYLVSLGISAVMLWFFGNLETGAPIGVGLAHTVVLSFPASIGGAAGRVVV